ncbi:MAG: SUMF1/EgtB/PvdO family nonheme iron enzyme [Alphaproteobacteria bacterium]|nr:SUMF1/EgtB/PvdO family nonheme iron enzyme [Alphaproteobacteria bacterium]
MGTDGQTLRSTEQDSLSSLSEHGPAEGDAPPPDATPSVEMPSTRYLDLGEIGRGGMGEVRRVLDRHLGCTLAMKTLAPRLRHTPAAVARFRTEIGVTARLIHPGVVAVQDHGLLPDGRPWFTMSLVHGDDLATVLREQGWPLRRRVEVLSRVCEVIAYAHAEGVIHRDLKPANVMVGSFGEVYVMDWGLARGGDALSEALAPEHRAALFEDPTPAHHTRHGQVMGTPAYMSPEQAEGRADLGPATDVYALGAMLWHSLMGRPPQPGATLEGPDELQATCRRAMDPDPSARHPDARALLDDLQGWLADLRRQEQAAALVAKADHIQPQIQALQEQARARREAGDRLLAKTAPHDPEARKRPGWALQDEATALEQRAALAELQWQQTLRGALNRVADWAPAHARLADHYAEALVRAEALHDHALAARMEALLRDHDRGRHAALLSGQARLTLRTTPADARVRLAPYIPDGRRRVLGPAEDLGPAPLIERSLPQGSYLLTLTAPGRHPARYPVLLSRGIHWDGRPPGAEAAEPIPLLPTGRLGPEDCYVPAGWCRIGGDPRATDAVSARRVWVDGFVLRRHPVTCAEYLGFLNALVEAGRPDEAARHAPRTQGQGEATEPFFTRDADGGYQLEPSPVMVGAPWQLDWPVTMVDWHAAVAYAAWEARRTGQPWRLPHDIEWEKAARGVDGRVFPWGDHGDPTWACAADTFAGPPSRMPVEDFPLDTSPYGARGMAGNVRDRCLNAYTREGPAPDQRLVLAPDDPDPSPYRMVRGGCWTSKVRVCRLASRFADLPDGRYSVEGFRLARSLTSADAPG